MTRLGRLLGLATLFVAWSSPSFAQDPDPDPVVADPERLERLNRQLEEQEAELRKTELVPPESVEPALGRAFRARDGFCKSGDHELSGSEAALCDLAPAAAKRCPGFAQACERYAAEHEKRAQSSASSGSGTGTGSDGDRSSRRRRHGGNRDRGDGEAAPDDKSSEGPSFEVSSSPFGNFLGDIITVVVWGLLALGIGAMLLAAIRAIVNRRTKDEPAPESKGSVAVERVQKPLVTGSPEELLERARRLARAGELKAATALLLRALLRHLEIGGVLELHPSRTNGGLIT